MDHDPIGDHTPNNIWEAQICLEGFRNIKTQSCMDKEREYGFGKSLGRRMNMIKTGCTKLSKN